MSRRTVVGLLVGLVGGFWVGHRSAPPEPSLFDEVPVGSSWVPSGASGPGQSCPSAESLSCQPEPTPPLSAAPLARLQREAPNCSRQPLDGNWIFSAEGEPVEVPPGADRFWFARYHGRPVTPMGQASRIEGALMHVGQLVLADPPQAVLAFYRLQFELNHLNPLTGMPQGRRGPLYLTFTPSNGLMHTVILVPGTQGTTVLASVGTPDPKAEARLPRDFPAPATVRDLHIDEIGDGPTLQRNITFTTQGTLEQLKLFFTQRLGAQGFAVDTSIWSQPGNSPRRWSRSFRRGARSIALTLQARTASVVEITAVCVNLEAPENAAP